MKEHSMHTGSLRNTVVSPSLHGQSPNIANTVRSIGNTSVEPGLIYGMKSVQVAVIYGGVIGTVYCILYTVYCILCILYTVSVYQCISVSYHISESLSVISIIILSNIIIFTDITATVLCMMCMRMHVVYDDLDTFRFRYASTSIYIYESMNLGVYESMKSWIMIELTQDNQQINRSTESMTVNGLATEALFGQGPAADECGLAPARNREAGQLQQAAQAVVCQAGPGLQSCASRNTHKPAFARQATRVE